MSGTTLRWLGFIVALLVVILILVESTDREGTVTDEGPLLPEMQAVLDDIDRIRVAAGGGEEPVVIEKEAQEWQVASRNGYPADTSHVRTTLLAMAEAGRIEQKTADPELHARLGLGAPDAADGAGLLVEASAGDEVFSALFGDVQGDYRYARIADENQSWLIDRNPSIPASAADWLAPEIIDLDTEQVKSVVITHPDGETIRLAKETSDDERFSVADIPEGRALSYATVADGIAGALNDLSLDDVRAAQAFEDAEPVTSEFVTFDGLTVVAEVYDSEGQKWLALKAQGDDESAAAINAAVDGWQFRIADYKADLLTRRWEDILQPPQDAAEP